MLRLLLLRLRPPLVGKVSNVRPPRHVRSCRSTSLEAARMRSARSPKNTRKNTEVQACTPWAIVSASTSVAGCEARAVVSLGAWPSFDEAVKALDNEIDASHKALEVDIQGVDREWSGKAA